MNYLRDADLPHTVYRFFAADGALLYVGCSRKLWSGRMTAHASDKTWYPQIATITLEHYDTLAPAADAEALAIHNESPRYNIKTPVTQCPKCGGHRTSNSEGRFRCKKCKREYGNDYYKRVGRAAYELRKFQKSKKVY